jgi:hypothetical protein
MSRATTLGDRVVVHTPPPPPPPPPQQNVPTSSDVSRYDRVLSVCTSALLIGSGLVVGLWALENRMR